MSYFQVVVNEGDTIEQVAGRVLSSISIGEGFYLTPGMTKDGKLWKPSGNRLIDMSLEILRRLDVKTIPTMIAPPNHVWEVKWQSFISGPTWEDWITETELWLDMNRAYDRFEELNAQRMKDNGLYMRNVQVVRKELKQ